MCRWGFVVNYQTLAEAPRFPALRQSRAVPTARQLTQNQRAKLKLCDATAALLLSK